MTFTRRWFADFLAGPLSKLFANYITTAVVPTKWRLATTCPIYERGDPEGVSNYRLVSLTFLIIKIFEKILKKALLSFLSETMVITPHQHGYLPRRCCLSNLLVFEEAVTGMMDEGHTHDVIYLDFDKIYLSQSATDFFWRKVSP